METSPTATELVINRQAGTILVTAEPAVMERAVRLLREGVKLDPGNGPEHTNLGAASLQDGRPREAVTRLETAVALDPDQAAGWNDLPVAEWRSGSLDAAREHLLRAAALNPSVASALVNLALIQAQAGDQVAALLTLRRALARPDVPTQAPISRSRPRWNGLDVPPRPHRSSRSTWRRQRSRTANSWSASEATWPRLQQSSPPRNGQTKSAQHHD